ncbi:MAG: universal stress protein [Microbacteriaceae bacterium]
MVHSTIVIGITASQPEAVVREALRLAQLLRCRLLCVGVDESRYVTDTQSDGSIVAMSINSDNGDIVIEEFDPQLSARIRTLAATSHVECEFFATAGNPSRVLAAVANDRDALMIVVGTRGASFGGTLREFFSGSVAANLAHRQHRPVLVVPLAPVALGEQLPWDGESL